jgi:hypothetical protein
VDSDGIAPTNSGERTCPMAAFGMARGQNAEDLRRIGQFRRPHEERGSSIRKKIKEAKSGSVSIESGTHRPYEIDDIVVNGYFTMYRFLPDQSRGPTPKNPNATY